MVGQVFTATDIGDPVDTVLVDLFVKIAFGVHLRAGIEYKQSLVIQVPFNFLQQSLYGSKVQQVIDTVIQAQHCVEWSCDRRANHVSPLKRQFSSSYTRFGFRHGNHCGRPINSCQMVPSVCQEHGQISGATGQFQERFGFGIKPAKDQFDIVGPVHIIHMPHEMIINLGQMAIRVDRRTGEGFVFPDHVGGRAILSVWGDGESVSLEASVSSPNRSSLPKDKSLSFRRR